MLSPTPVTQIEYTVSQVSAGDSHVVALTTCGKVLTWGCGEFGEAAVIFLSNRFYLKNLLLDYKPNHSCILGGIVADCDPKVERVKMNPTMYPTTHLTLYSKKHPTMLFS